MIGGGEVRDVSRKGEEGARRRGGGTRRRGGEGRVLGEGEGREGY